MRAVAYVLAFLAVFAGVVAPSAYAGSCVVHRSSFVAVKNVAAVELAPIAVPTIFFQFLNPTPVQLPTPVQATVAAPETETSRIDRLIRERLEAIINEHLKGEVDDLPSVDEPVATGLPALASLQLRCASCHTAPTVKGNVVLFDASGAFAPNVAGSKILAAITPDATGLVHMPPAAKGSPTSIHAVSPADREALRQILAGR